tara:strand:- start:5043 stop:6239 length:1197 start_codon:yes stop_codon:yes gene_type:complete
MEVSQTLKLIGRKNQIFDEDMLHFTQSYEEKIKNSSFLVIGGAGSIGQSVTKEIFKFNPKRLHVVDISENNTVELVRDIRSSLGYIKGDFKTFAIDCGSNDFKSLVRKYKSYDYIFNLSALKHVRSEKDPFTLMRMIQTNIINSIEIAKISKEIGAKKYFCVSTDKAANPVNMMGASKRIMEIFLMKESEDLNISMARFANVAFSDGSLLHGFNQRFQKLQPIAAPNDVLRYFITGQESGQLCLMSALMGDNRDIFFPKLNENLHLIRFSDIAINYLDSLGFEPFICSSEDEARDLAGSLIKEKKWPCYFFKSDTTGEKDFEEFYTDHETLDLNTFKGIGIIKNNLSYDKKKLNTFLEDLDQISKDKSYDREQFINMFQMLIGDFDYKNTGKFLDEKM